jgi:hypothetical protein
LQAADKAIDKHAKVPDLRYLRAVVYAAQHDLERCMAALENAVANGFNDLRVLQKEARLREFREDPRFVKILDDLEARRQIAIREREEQSRQEGSQLPPTRLHRSRLRGCSRRWIAHSPGPAQCHRGWTSSISRETHAPYRLLRQNRDCRVLGPLVLFEPPAAAKPYPAARRAEGQGLVVLTLCYEPSVEKGQKLEVEESAKVYLQSFAGELPCAVVDANTAARFGVSTYPHTTIFASDGRLALSAPGVLDAATLRSLTLKAIEAKTSPLPASPNAIAFRRASGPCRRPAPSAGPLSERLQRRSRTCSRGCGKPSFPAHPKPCPQKNTRKNHVQFLMGVEFGTRKP